MSHDNPAKSSEPRWGDSRDREARVEPPMQRETPRTGDWWCPECKEALPASRVTFTERCDTCGTPVHVAGEGEVARLERELAQKDAHIRELEAAIEEKSKEAARWERMYVCAQNANLFRQAALDGK